MVSIYDFLLSPDFTERMSESKLYYVVCLGLKLLAYGALAGGLLTDSTIGRGESEVFGEGMFPHEVIWEFFSEVVCKKISSLI